MKYRELKRVLGLKSTSDNSRTGERASPLEKSPAEIPNEELRNSHSTGLNGPPLVYIKRKKLRDRERMWSSDNTYWSGNDYTWCHHCIQE